MVPSALGQCGMATKPMKPAVWHPQYGGAHLMMVRAARGDDDEKEPSIVGMWHVIFTATTGPVTGVIDNSVVVWHSDGTEIMNSSRPAQDGNFCLGVWTQTGELKYYLNHIPWQGNAPSADFAIGPFQGGAQSPDGNSYSGSFTLDAYDVDGNPSGSFSGTLKAKRITTNTSFNDVFSGTP
jgi:hypothetical protein